MFHIIKNEGSDINQSENGVITTSCGTNLENMARLNQNATDHSDSIPFIHGKSPCGRVTINHKEIRAEQLKLESP